MQLSSVILLIVQLLGSVGYGITHLARLSGRLSGRPALVAYWVSYAAVIFTTIPLSDHHIGLFRSLIIPAAAVLVFSPFQIRLNRRRRAQAALKSEATTSASTERQT